VLNSEHSEWLAGPEMGIPREKICTTAHWVGERFRPVPADASHSFPGVQPHEKVLLFVGRISEEKGIMQLPAIYSVVKQAFPEIRLAVAGAGPALDRLRAALPDALYLGWVDTEDLPRLYSAADLLLLPSRFDTFGCVVLEAMSCGLPVVAYNTKGPKDIIRNGVNGFLAESEAEFPALIARYLADHQLQKSMRSSALEASSHFRPDDILKRLLEDIGLSGRRGPRRATQGNRSSRQMHSRQPADSGYPSILSDLLDIVSAGA
jgi:glycosyltransferase involved in cell wall biosynthesis